MSVRLYTLSFPTAVLQRPRHRRGGDKTASDGSLQPGGAGRHGLRDRNAPPLPDVDLTCPCGPKPTACKRLAEEIIWLGQGGALGAAGFFSGDDF